ncbi:MAG: aromatic amino acid lyase, partial [Acidimicrobiales bacterium]
PGQPPAGPGQAPAGGKLSGHGARLARSHATGTGPLLSAEVTRAMLAVRLNQLGAGGAGVRPAVMKSLEAVLNGGAVPAVHAGATIGTGDLTPLAELSLALAGEGEWHPEPALLDLPQPLELDAGDILALMSSNARTLGEAALASVDAAGLLAAADTVASLSLMAVSGQVEALDARVQEAKPHPGQVEAAARLRRLVGAGVAAPARLQDPISFRCLPQVHGAAIDALARLDQVLGVELNAAAENPVLVPGQDGRPGAALHNGNFHGVQVALALDTVRAALVQVGGLSVGRLAGLVDPEVTGLRRFLAGPDPGASGAMVLPYLAQDALADLRALAHPVTLAPLVLSLGGEDHASFAPSAARQSTAALRPLTVVVAAELVAAMRALRQLRRRPATPAASVAYDRAAAVLPDDDRDRSLSADVDLAVGLVDRWRRDGARAP